MASTGIVNAETRTVTGSAAARRLRSQGLVPCALHTLAGGHAMLLQASRHSLDMMLRLHATENIVVDLVVADAPPRKALLKEAQHDPISGDLVHLDFFEISMTEKMQSPVPVVLIGEPAGVTQGGGLLEQLLREVEVECLPGDMIEEIEADVSALGLGAMLTVGDLVLPPGLDVLTASDIGVALVSAPRSEAEADVPEEGAATEAEPERIGEKKDETDTDEKSDRK